MRHQSKSGEESPTECVEACIAVVRIWTKSLKTNIILFALAKCFRRLVSLNWIVLQRLWTHPAPDELPQSGGSIGSASPKYQLAEKCHLVIKSSAFVEKATTTYFCYYRNQPKACGKSFPTSCPISWCTFVSAHPCRFVDPSMQTQTVKTLLKWLHHADSSQILWQHQR